jgi:hypothetical protein
VSLLLRATRGAILGAIGRFTARRPVPRRAGRAARAALLWAIAALAVGNIAFVGLADCFAPEVYDPQYGARLARLRAARAEHPDRPLLVVLGSSRTCQLFRPEAMAPLETADGRTVLPFNFSHHACGPIYCRLAYGRLRRQGLTPDYAVVELMPVFFVRRFESFFNPAATADELPDLVAYTAPDRAAKFYARYRYVPWRANRAGVVRRFAPVWSIPFPHDDPNNLDRLGGDGGLLWWASDETRNTHTARTVAKNVQLTANFRIDPGADRALCDLLRECREAGTRVVLVRTPESTAYQAGYAPGTIAAMDEYAARLGRDFGVPVIDARGWLPDDHFFDGDHPLMPGQALFTERFHREVLVPLVSGR